MKISHKTTNVSGKDIVYIYITVEDIYEFGKENLGKGENSDFLTKLREYINNNLKTMKKAAAVIVINGVVVGSLTLAALYPAKNTSNEKDNNLSQVQVYEESENKVEQEIKADETKKEKEETKIEQKEEEKSETKQETNNEVKTNTSNKTTTSNKASANKTNTTNKTSNSTTNKTTNTPSIKKPSTTTNTTTKPSTNTSTPTTSKPTTNDTTSTTTQTTKPTTSTDTSATTKPSSSTTNTTTTTSSSGKTIKFNNGGVVTNIDLEEYVIGVVAAEMPAAFHSEALKAQAVVTRTYAMKKASQGITLVNSTSHQVYNSIEQMKAKWGSSYSTYYNKIKNAVNATKGKVLKYNGQYIEALYFSMSNGKTELPSYVWSTNYPYLQVVSSSWDENLSAAKYTVSMTYSTLSSKLGVVVDANSEINILSRTAGDRVNEISIAGKTFTGVKVRSLLGLRSADFTITKTSTGIKITTKGFGHGVGMSQYGANGAAKAGYTYKQILNHYYSGASLVSL